MDEDDETWCARQEAEAGLGLVSDAALLAEVERRGYNLDRAEDHRTDEP